MHLRCSIDVDPAAPTPLSLKLIPDGRSPVDEYLDSRLQTVQLRRLSNGEPLVETADFRLHVRVSATRLVLSARVSTSLDGAPMRYTLGVTSGSSPLVSVRRATSNGTVSVAYYRATEGDDRDFEDYRSGELGVTFEIRIGWSAMTAVVPRGAASRVA